MAKRNGLGSNLYLGGYDISGDVNALSKVGGGPEMQKVEGLDNLAAERLGLIRSAEMTLSAWFNPARAHPVLSALPTADVILVYAGGMSLGDIAAGLNAKQINYDPTRGANGALSLAISCQSTGYPLHWGKMLTAGKRTDTGAANGTGVDMGSGWAAVAISSVSVANPTHVVTATPHGMSTGDSVLISGVTSTPSVNGHYTVTVVSATEFTVPVDVTVGAGAAGTAQRTSYAYGASAYLEVFSFTGTDMTVNVQDSADDVTYADVAGLTFTQVTAAPTAEIKETASGAIVREYVRAKSSTTGGFNPATFAVMLARHEATGAI